MLEGDELSFSGLRLTVDAKHGTKQTNTAEWLSVEHKERSTTESGFWRHTVVMMMKHGQRLNLQALYSSIQNRSTEATALYGVQQNLPAVLRKHRRRAQLHQASKAEKGTASVWRPGSP